MADESENDNIDETFKPTVRCVVLSRPFEETWLVRVVALNNDYDDDYDYEYLEDEEATNDDDDDDDEEEDDEHDTDSEDNTSDNQTQANNINTAEDVEAGLGNHHTANSSQSPASVRLGHLMPPKAHETHELLTQAEESEIVRRGGIVSQPVSGSQARGKMLVYSSDCPFGRFMCTLFWRLTLPPTLSKTINKQQEAYRALREMDEYIEMAEEEAKTPVPDVLRSWTPQMIIDLAAYVRNDRIREMKEERDDLKKELSESEATSQEASTSITLTETETANTKIVPPTCIEMLRNSTTGSLVDLDDTMWVCSPFYGLLFNYHSVRATSSVLYERMQTNKNTNKDVAMQLALHMRALVDLVQLFDVQLQTKKDTFCLKDALEFAANCREHCKFINEINNDAR